MAAIKKDGIYRASDGSQFQFRKGHELTDEQIADLERVGDFPDAEAEAKAADASEAEAEANAAEADADAKAADAPENKAAPAPSNKAAK